MSIESASAQGDAALEASGWPLGRAGDALEALVRAAGLAPARARAPVEAPSLALSLATSDGCSQALGVEARRLGVDVVAVNARYPEVRRLLESAAPALFVFAPRRAEPERGRAPACWLAVLSRSRDELCVIDPSGRRRVLGVQLVQAALVAPLEARVQTSVQQCLLAAGLAPRRRDRARRALLGDRLANTLVEGCWLVQPRDRGPLPARARGTLASRLGLLAFASLAQYLLWGFAWQRVAEGGLYGSVDPGQLTGWLLALLTTLPLQALISWRSARDALDVGAWLRQRLLGGLLARGSDAVRGAGVGQLLGRVLEAGAVESLGLGGVLLAGLSLLDLGVAATLLAQGTARAALLGLFMLTLLATCSIAWLSARRRAAWTASRLALTHELVECMAGQRTRIAQQAPARWHSGEDAALEAYVESGRAMDLQAALLAQLPRVWLVAGAGYLALGVLPAEPAPTLELALSMGGVLLGQRALTGVTAAVARLSGAWIAWQNVVPLVSGTEPDPSPSHVEPRADPATQPAPVRPDLGQRRFSLRARGLCLIANEHRPALLTATDFDLRAGDRVLLEGPSGAGKSSLARTLAGVMPPRDGSLLLDGLDRATLGRDAWRRRVTLVPQFHDNHVFAATLAFNLLLGRRWPAQPSDLADATRVCHELGLGPLLERMPLGLLQIVGETGWQLSHGERSRVFAARALLGRGELVVLDESLAALDPATALRVLDCAEMRARALLLIAHPGAKSVDATRAALNT